MYFLHCLLEIKGPVQWIGIPSPVFFGIPSSLGGFGFDFMRTKTKADVAEMNNPE